MIGRKAWMILLAGALMTGAMPVVLSGDVINTQTAGSAVQAEAESLYGTEVVVHPGEDARFAAAFPEEVELFYVLNHTQAPPVTHAMAYYAGAGYDLTENFNGLLGDLSVVLSSEQEVLEFAQAFAQVGNAEIQQSRQVVNSSDNAWLGTSQVEDPVVTQFIDGWEVDLWTWSEENGVLADWHFVFSLTKLREAKWLVKDINVGPAEGDMFGTNLEGDIRIVNDWDNGYELLAGKLVDGQWQQMTLGIQGVDTLPCDTEGTPVAEVESFDDAYWRAWACNADPAAPVVQQAAQALVDGGSLAYNQTLEQGAESVQEWRLDPDAKCTDGNGNPFDNPDPNWGFIGDDPDCQRDVFVFDDLTLTCIVCIQVEEDNTQYPIEMYVTAVFKEHLNALGYYTDLENHTQEEVAHSVMANLMTRYIMFLETGWEPKIPAALDGIPRAAQFWLNPDAETEPSSLLYGNSDVDGDASDLDGISDYQHAPRAGLCNGPTNADASHAGSYALYWGHEVQRSPNGPGTVLTRTFSNMAENATEVCDPSAMPWIQPSIYDQQWGHEAEVEDYATNLSALSVDMYHRTFTWQAQGQSWDIGAELPEMTRDIATSVEDSSAPPFSIHAVETPPTFEASDVSCLDLSGDGLGADGWEAQLILTQADGSVSVEEIPCDSASHAVADHETAALTVVRAVDTYGGVEVVFT